MANGKVKWYHDGWKKGVITPNVRGGDVVFRQRVVVGGVKLAEGVRVQFKAVDREATWVRRT